VVVVPATHLPEEQLTILEAVSVRTCVDVAANHRFDRLRSEQAQNGALRRLAGWRAAEDPRK